MLLWIREFFPESENRKYSSHESGSRSEPESHEEPENEESE